MKISTILVAGFALGCSVTSSNAQDAAKFLKSLAGEYSGRGTAVVLGEKVTRISCKISNKFADNEATLTIGGNCASSKGKGKVNGSLVATGNTLTGTFISPRRNAKVTRSSASLKEGKLHLFASLFDEKASKLVKVHQQVSRSSNGITALFFTFDNKTRQYEQSGSIELERR